MSKTSELSQFPPSYDPDWWKKYWMTQGQRWRIEPEIAADRQKELNRLRSTAIDVSPNSHPFRDVKLSRADIEWLLATHESEGMYGPVIYNDERQWRRKGIDISGADLSKVNLSYLPLSKMQGTTFSQGTTNTLQTFTTINMEKANLTGTHLEGAYLVQANMKKANMIAAYLEEANLEEAHLEGADCKEAHFEEAILSGAHLDDGYFIRAHFEEASFREAHMERCNCGEAYLERTDFRGACITNARFSKAHMEGADFRNSYVNQGIVDFRMAHMEGVNLEESFFEKADFREAHLGGAYLGEAHLEKADFRKAYLAGVDFRAAHLEGTDFKEAHLEGKKFRLAELKRIREWLPNFPEELDPADWREALLGSATRLKDVVFGDKKKGSVLIADVSWGDVNLNVIDWDSVSQIGDEYRAKLYSRQRKDKTGRLEEYRAAVRANRQLAVALQNQGLNEVAARFSYNAQVLQRIVLNLQGNFGRYLLSWLLDLLVGYGYKPIRSFIAYIFVILLFMIVYRLNAVHLTWLEAFIISATAFGRGFAPGMFSPDDPTAFASIFEAFMGLIIEATFIAALTQRFFGK